MPLRAKPDHAVAGAWLRSPDHAAEGAWLRSPDHAAMTVVRGAVAARSVVVAVDRDACFVEQKRAVLVHRWEAAGRIQVSELFGGQRENNAAEAGPVDSASAHAAGLTAGVHGGGSSGAGLEFTGGPSGQLQFGVGNDVAVGEHRVVIFPEYGAVRADQQ